MIIGIVAAGMNWEIGKNNDLLFKLKEDMKFFRMKTVGNIVVMGENTLLSLPHQKPLNDRSNIVLCPEGHEYENCICYHNFDKMVHDLKILSNTNNIYIVGGAMLYKSMLPYYDRVYVNKVNATDKDATAFFPNLDENTNFEIHQKSNPTTDSGYETQLYVYIKKEDDNNA